MCTTEYERECDIYSVFIRNNRFAERCAAYSVWGYCRWLAALVSFFLFQDYQWAANKWWWKCLSLCSNRARKLETDVTPVQIISGVLPWFHAFGCLTLFLNAMREARTVFLPKFHEKHFLHSIQVMSGANWMNRRTLSNIFFWIHYCRNTESILAM